MYTIWFQLAHDGEFKIEAVSLDQAQRLWDVLRREFYMRSERP